MNVADLELHDKVTVGVGIPFQLAWSILGWFAVSVKHNMKLTKWEQFSNKYYKTKIKVITLGKSQRT